MLNRIIVMGRLTRDPELRRTQTGISVTSFSVAVSRDFKSQNGERETDFIDVVAWRNTAEFVTKYFTKGSMAVVDGRLQIRDWTDREGQKRKSAEIVADNVYFGSTRQENSDYNGPSYGGALASPSYGSAAPSYGGTPSYGSAVPGYGGNSAPGYGSAPAYGGNSGYGSGSTPGYDGTSSPAYSGTSAPGYGAAPAQSDFAELGGEEDGDLPF